METIAALEALRLIIEKPEQVACLDVRSEGEFAAAGVPHFKNIPILTNEERHLVGLCYKERGQDEAVKLGYELVSPHKAKLQELWAQTLGKHSIKIVCCWRGGLRSQIAAQWLKEINHETFRVDGGSKALRHELMRQFDQLPELIVVAGPTGSGKTKLLNSIDEGKIDLEALAVHRGSAFGRNLLIRQPSQITFENTLACSLWLQRQKGRPILFENESRAIGSVHLPISLLERINTAPIINIKMDVAKRVSLLVEDYIISPLAAGVTKDLLQSYYETSLSRVKSKLGGLKETQIRSLLREAFQSQTAEAHRGWIQELLIHYYDKTYAHSLKRTSHKIIFEGDWQSCRQWIQSQFA